MLHLLDNLLRHLFLAQIEEGVDNERVRFELAGES